MSSSSSAERRCADGRLHAVQCAPRRHAMLRPGLLDRRALRAPGLHVRRGEGAGPFRLRAPWDCIASRRPACRRTKPRRNLLAKAGFRQEGLARRYLLINGEWRDHVLFALLEGRSAARLSRASPRNLMAIIAAPCLSAQSGAIAGWRGHAAGRCRWSGLPRGGWPRRRPRHAAGGGQFRHQRQCDRSEAGADALSRARRAAPRPTARSGTCCGHQQLGAARHAGCCWPASRRASRCRSCRAPRAPPSWRWRVRIPAPWWKPPPAYGRRAWRVIIPPVTSVGLALRVGAAETPPALYGLDRTGACLPQPPAGHLHHRRRRADRRRGADHRRPRGADRPCRAALGGADLAACCC